MLWIDQRLPPIYNFTVPNDDDANLAMLSRSICGFYINCVERKHIRLSLGIGTEKLSFLGFEKRSLG